MFDIVASVVILIGVTAGVFLFTRFAHHRMWGIPGSQTLGCLGFLYATVWTFAGAAPQPWGWFFIILVVILPWIAYGVAFNRRERADRRKYAQSLAQAK